MSFDVRVGFIGGGNMAKAISKGLIKKGLITGDKIMISSPTDCTRSEWEGISIKTTSSNSEVVKFADVVFLSFKPYQLEAALYPMKSEIPNKSKLFVSVLAGVTCSTLRKILQKNVQENARLIRVMPNTPAMVLEGCSVLVADPTANAFDVDLVYKMFCALGKCEIVTEPILSAVTGLTGSGPAYVYIIIEALSDGAVKQGISRELATKFAAQTVLGAAKMVLETKKHPAELKDDVCSAGGTTIHGVHVLERHKLRATIMDAIEAAVHRGIEIGKASENK